MQHSAKVRVQHSAKVFEEDLLFGTNLADADIRAIILIIFVEKGGIVWGFGVDCYRCGQGPASRRRETRVRQESDKSFSAACPKTPPKRRCSTDAYPRKTSSQGHRNAMTMPSPHQRIAIAQQSQQHPKSGKDLLTRASQSKPLNQGCARMSLAPPFRLPSRRDRSAVSSPDIISRAVPENVD